MPRFAILEHDHPHRHWDLMLEAKGMLRTWRLEAPPEERRPFVAEPIADHRLVYLEYEGPVSGNRGTVSRWDGGAMEWLVDEPTRLVVRVSGARIGGIVELQRRPDDRWEGVWRPSVCDE
ncbi:MAG: hypothetical protein KatS3mg105_4723 [Gemmatales bacterium]|nr:MAG: hypothetical protein KatS3mg105_4723 [Gemmatales bacterium]